MSNQFIGGGAGTVLFQPPNHVGLGHVSRLSAIALALRQIDPLIRTPFVIEGGNHVLLETLGLPYLPLPSDHAFHESDSWKLWVNKERSSLAIEISRAIVEAVKPQIVVFDCIPNPGFLSVIRERQIPVVLCLREMKELDRYLRYADDVLGIARLILLPHDDGAFELPPDLREKARFVGRITRPVHTPSARRPDSDHSRVVITGGGGGYPGTVEFYNLATEAICDLRRHRPEVEAHLIVGPLFRDWLQLKHSDGITVVPFEPDINSVFEAAHVVIAQAGYNTVAELEQIAVRAILVPWERQWDDQFSRVEKSVRQYARFKGFHGSSRSELAQLIADCLDSPSPLKTIQADGAPKAAKYLHELLQI